MKKLFLPALILALPVYAANSDFKEISDEEIKNKFVSTIRDAEVEGRLNASSEFTECRDENKFEPNNADPSKLAKATQCFQNKLKGKSAEQLKQLAENLQLESYGLIKSKNVKDITEYLSNKMIKSLTGRDPNEKDPQKLKEQLQFKNQKFVDQQVFMELYVNQLGKTALHEVSRFCFENLRNTQNTSSKSFYEHWTNGYTLPAAGVITNLDDSGEPRFEVFEQNTPVDISKKDEVFNAMSKGITRGQIDAKTMETFFGVCQSAIKPLCDKFKKEAVVTNDSVADQSQALPSTTTKTSKMTSGANACLTMQRLQSVRAAMTKSKAIIESMNKMSEADRGTALALVLEDPIKLYNRGKDPGEETVDELTAVASTDLLENQDKAYQDKLDECIKDGSSSGCEDGIGKKEDFDKALHSIEMDTNLKREIELARVEELRKDKQKLKEYLEENGYFQLLKDNPNLDNEVMIKEAIKHNFNAKKAATIEALKTKVGGRQVVAEDASDDDKKTVAHNVAKESREERARLAQVVLFNNIITSHLTLNKKDANGNLEKIGRNVNAWKKEQKGLDSGGGKYDTTVFKNLQDSMKDEDTSKLKDASIVDVGIIDTILGKQDDSTAKKP